VAECTCDAVDISTMADMGRGERVHVRGLANGCEVHGGPVRDVYVGADGKHYPSRAEAGWNEAG
jgi:hypothetical protein